VSAALELRDAEGFCRRMARREAGNFYWGFVALPPEQRVAIYALYDFARQVDDAADRGLGGLAEHRLRLQRCLRGDYGDPVMRVLGPAIERHGIPVSELEELIRGVEMDLEPRRYRDWPELEAYCRLVASVVGRMCVRVFGYRDPAALVRADRLGLALQLINILRDVREDAGLGRLYLPLDDLQRFGLEEAEVLGGEPGPGWEALVGFEAVRARALLEDGLRVTELIPRRAAACVRTMAGIYEAILERIELDPRAPLAGRVSISPAGKLAVLGRAWLRPA
jgi:15-cis-phytoene synthase